MDGRCFHSGPFHYCSIFQRRISLFPPFTFHLPLSNVMWEEGRKNITVWVHSIPMPWLYTSILQIAWVGIPTAPAWLPTDMLIKVHRQTVAFSCLNYMSILKNLWFCLNTNNSCLVPYLCLLGCSLIGSITRECNDKSAVMKNRLLSSRDQRKYCFLGFCSSSISNILVNGHI